MVKRIAIPSSGDMVDAHFGRAQAFTVFDIEKNAAQKVETLSSIGLEHQHAGLTSLFKQNGIEALVCGGIGGGMIENLNRAGLEVITGASGNIMKVAQNYAEGTLVSTGSVCQEHHDH